MSIKVPSVRRALDEALAGRDLRPELGAAVALAKRLASEIDDASDPDVVARLTARYLPTLEALGMTMTRTAGAAKGGKGDVPISALDELKARRAALGQR